MDSLHRLRKIVSAMLLGPLSTVAWAGWQPVVTLDNERFDLDLNGALHQGDGTVLIWSRWQRDGVWVDDAGRRYSSIEVLNRYHCRERRAETLRRLWRLDGRVVHEQGADDAPARPVIARSLESRLLAAACQPATVARTVAKPAAKTAAPGAEERPRPMYADMLGSGAPAQSEAVVVADAGSRPRFIDLPKIDPSQLEKPQALPPDPAPSVPAKPAVAPHVLPAVTPAQETPSAAAQLPPARSSPPVPRAETPAAVSRAEPPSPVSRAEPSPPRALPAARHEIERQYASSGPRRSAPKADKAEPTKSTGGHDKGHWSYEGETGPRHWGKLDAKFALCDKGERQSPIDLRNGIKVELEPIRFHYRPTQFRIVNNGHTVQVEVEDGLSMRVNGREYQLRQFHFHRPSEERIDGMAFDMVIHLVHGDFDDNLAVVAVLLEAGGENPVIQTLWNHIPLEKGVSVASLQPIDLNLLLPNYRGYYTYMGSLTTPPCTEGVLWLVFKQPVMVSPEQIAIFSRLYRNNTRPIQPHHGRLIKESR